MKILEGRFIKLGGFTAVGLVPIEYEKPVIDPTARTGRGLKIPGEPTLAERRQHELTHLPLRDWCPHCVKAKGRHGPAKKQSDRQPVIQIDYCLHATSEDLPSIEKDSLSLRRSNRIVYGRCCSSQRRERLRHCRSQEIYLRVW